MLITSYLRFLFVTLSIGFLSSLVTNCSSDGETDVDVDSFDLEVGEPLEGRLINQAGEGEGFTDWQILLVRQSGQSYRAALNSLGGFVFRGVDISSPYTLVLLDKDFRYTASLKPGSLVESSLASIWFRFTGRVLPTLSLAGDQLKFSSEEEVVYTPSSADLDQDGDGLLTWFDDNDNGNDLIDAFDPEASESGNEFSGALASLQIQSIFEKTASDFTLTLRPVVKLRENSNVGRIKLVTRAASLDKAQVFGRKDDGSFSTALESFDGLLLDDGVSDDERADDLIFGRKIFLSGSDVFHSQANDLC